MDVSPIYAYFVQYADETGLIKMDTLMQDELIQNMIDNSVPLKKILDWCDMGEIHLESLTYMFTTTKLFSLHPKQDFSKKKT
eukprot:UN13181